MKLADFLFFFLGFTMMSASDGPFDLHEIAQLRPTKAGAPLFLAAKDGERLAYYPFLVATDKERAVAILYHGGGAYSMSLYQWMAEQLQQHGVSTYCADLRGHGYSGGQRGDAPTIDTVYDDVSAMISLVRSKHPGLPVHLIGHSSGGGLLCNYHHNRRDSRVAGYIMLAPFLGPKSGTIRYEGTDPRSFVKHARGWLFVLNALLPVSWFHHVDAVYFNYSESLKLDNPLLLSVYTYTMSSATTPYDIHAILSSWGNTPLHIFVGSNDEQFLPDRYKILLQATRGNTSDVTVVAGAKHLSILKQSPDLIIQCIK